MMKSIPFMKPINILPVALLALSANAGKVASIPMELNGSIISETCSGASLYVEGIRLPATVAGARGASLRFDGYSNTASGLLPELLPAGNQSATFSVWVAPQTYPMMSLDTPSSEGGLIIGNLDKESKTGFAFRMTREGQVLFETYGGGWPISVKSEESVPRSEWTRLTAVMDGETRELSLWFGDRKVATGKCMNSVSIPSLTMRVGGDAEGTKTGPFRIDTFNGLIDDFELYDQAILPTASIAENVADTSVAAPEIAAHPWRPLFHAMPSSSWMNESHGLAYSDGKYHLFFQKNGNGPYMSRLHWGHVVSEDLCTWKELPVAIATETPYDIKGCWSGCVFTDEELTQGRPQIFYTAVDYERARIATAKASDDSLLEWSKPDSNPLVDGRPDGLSDDFRDCFLFRDGSNLYMIVGTSKDNRGAATLHRYDARTDSWSNTGELFFQAGNPNVAGRFWEMPNVTKIGDKWLFTVTPLDMTGGVQCLYWIGEINADGTFSPITPVEQPGHFELNGFAKDGFGLLSPSIMKKDGKTIAMGIVPDKLPSEINYEMGWAHNISFPRELTISSDNKLIQKPYSGLESLRRQESGVMLNDLSAGVKDIQGIDGRHFNIVMQQGAENGEFGFDFFKGAGGAGHLRFDSGSRRLTVDLRDLNRVSNDGWIFNGLYETTVPVNRDINGNTKVEVMVDGSVMEIFIDDSFACSLRVFPKDSDATGIEIVNAVPLSWGGVWSLSAAEGAGIEDLPGHSAGESSFIIGESAVAVHDAPAGSRLCAWTIEGRMLGDITGKGYLELTGLPSGLVIVTLQRPSLPTLTAKTFIR